MHYFEAEELAARLAGIDPETDNDYDSKAEEWLAEKWEISIETFQEIAEALVKFTVPVETAISGHIAQGFVHDGSFICKEYVEK